MSKYCRLTGRIPVSGYTWIRSRPLSAPYPIAAAPTYHRHRPEQTELYSIINQHYPRFVEEIERSGGHLPRFVHQEFENYLKCGLLEHGFLRVKCEGCRHEHLVAFSCKRRGFCPICGARRMVDSAAHLVDHVFPEVPVRQWVLTFPFPLRFLLAAQPEALTQVLAVVQRGILTSDDGIVAGLKFTHLPPGCRPGSHQAAHRVKDIKLSQ